MARRCILIDMDDTMEDARDTYKYIPQDSEVKTMTSDELRRAWDNYQTKLCESFLPENEAVTLCVRGTLVQGTGTILPIFLTSRESTPKLIKYTSDKIEDFLLRSGLNKDNHLLLMRKFNDYGEPAEVKESILQTSVLGRFDIIYAIDDNPQVIEMYRRLNIPTLQFRYGGGDDR